MAPRKLHKLLLSESIFLKYHLIQKQRLKRPRPKPPKPKAPPGVQGIPGRNKQPVKPREIDNDANRVYENLRADVEQFQQLVRMNINTFDYILAKIRSKITSRHTTTLIQPELALLITITFLARGESFRTLQTRFPTVTGLTTISKVIKRTINHLYKELQPIHMKTPGKEDFKRIACEFESTWNFPYCIGAIDTRHIRITNHYHTGSHQPFPSVVFQAVVDAWSRFLSVDVGSFGEERDLDTFQKSKLCKALESKTTNIPDSNNCVFVADEAYPLLENLLTPFPGQNLDDKEEYFNSRLFEAQRVAEKAMEILAEKWHLLLRPIWLAPNLVGEFVQCCCLLNNIIIDREGIPETSTRIDAQFTSGIPKIKAPENPKEPSDGAKAIRENFAELFFRNQV